MNTEVRKFVNQVKKTQKKFQQVVKKGTLVEEVKKYAEKQSGEFKKLLKADVKRVKTFIDREKKELDRFQKQIPTEVKKIKKFITSQRTELEKLLKTVKKTANTKKTAGTKKATKKKTTRKKSASRKKAPSTTVSA